MRKKLPADQKEQENNYQKHTQTKKRFIEPKLKFIKPKLTKHGDATSITSGPIIGTGSPGGF